jgi:uncharacterized membrane protein YccC
MPEGDLRTALRERLRDPVGWTDALQLTKTVLAVVAAWVVSTYVFGFQQAFLAPWSALLVVHSTVYRTLAEGAQQVAATVVGVALAWMTGNLFGLDPVALGVMVLAALVIGKIPPLRLDGTAVAATAVIVLTIGQADDNHVLLLRFLETGVGILVGLVVNLAVWPPLRDLSAARAIDAIDDLVGDLLCDIAKCIRDGCGLEDARAWVHRSREIDAEIADAWAYVRQAGESGRLNPRPSARTVKRTDQFGDLLLRMEQATAEIRSVARTLGHSLTDLKEWDEAFKVRWVDLLEEAGAAIQESDSQRIAGVRLGLQDLAHDLSTDDLSGKYWSEYGGLMLNLRNVVTAMDQVAESNPIIAPAMSDSRRRLRG